MPVPSSITDLSTTAGSNYPAGTETPTEGDNYIRTLSAFIAQLRDMLNGTSGAPQTLSLTITNGLTVGGAAALNGSLAVAGTTTLNGALVANGNTTLGNAASDTLAVPATAAFAEAIAASKGIAPGNSAVVSPTVLDYYLESSAGWTPTVLGSTTPGSTTYTSQTGTYTRVGNRVFAQFTVLYSAATGTGSAEVSLPVAAATTVGADAPIGFGYFFNAAPLAEIVQISLRGGSTTSARFQYKSGTAINAVPMSNNAATVSGVLVYEAA